MNKPNPHTKHQIQQALANLRVGDSLIVTVKTEHGPRTITVTRQIDGKLLLESPAVSEENTP
jgi:hypothetical protein